MMEDVYTAPNNLPTLDQINLAKSVFGDKYEEWSKGFFTDMPDDRDILDEIQKEHNRQKGEQIQNTVNRISDNGRINRHYIGHHRMYME